MVSFSQGVLLLEQGHADRAIAPLNEAWKLVFIANIEIPSSELHLQNVDDIFKLGSIF